MCTLPHWTLILTCVRAYINIQAHSDVHTTSLDSPSCKIPDKDLSNQNSKFSNFDLDQQKFQQKFFQRNDNAILYIILSLFCLLLIIFRYSRYLFMCFSKKRIFCLCSSNVNYTSYETSTISKFSFVEKFGCLDSLKLTKFAYLKKTNANQRKKTEHKIHRSRVANLLSI